MTLSCLSVTKLYCLQINNNVEFREICKDTTLASCNLSLLQIDKK